MTGTWASFLPGLAVLAVGLAAGFLLSKRLQRSRRTRASGASERAVPTGGAAASDLDLERQDLEARRDQIYARLRSDQEELGEADRRDLERAAARAIRRLEELGAGAARATAPNAGTAASPAATTAAPRGASAGIVGFAFGAGFAALVAVLFYWVARDAKPAATAGPEATAAAGAADPDTAHSRLGELSPQAKARVAAIMAHLEKEPNDIEARKALTETFVTEGLFFEAFEQTQKILEQSPGDVDGLYFQGLIRLTMGQDEVALALLDQALTTEPGFVSARLVRGLAHMRRGERDAAVDDWRRGLEAAGGHHEGLERLLQLAASGASAEEILGSPPPPAEPPHEVPSGPAAELAQAAAASASGAGAVSGPAAGAYQARVELAPGVTAPPGAVLFVNLRIVAGAGPPVAVKRISSPTFPLEITLDGNDAMPGLAGRPLPPNGVIAARLDKDGNASTRDDAEPSAQADAALGKSVTLVLR